MRTLTVALVLAALAAGAALVLLRDPTRIPSPPDDRRPSAVAAHAGRHGATALAGVPRFLGDLPANSEALARAHKPHPAELPAAPAGDVVEVQMTLKDVTVEIAPGVKYEAWGFDGRVPGPHLHVREGQTVEITLENQGTIPHSIDFHAARIAPEKAFVDVAPGESFTYRFKASDPGVFMYHCFTTPILQHVANGMYGAIVVDPVKPLPKADREYVLVASEWYLDSPGHTVPARISTAKAQAALPDWATFNGYAKQYLTHPLEAEPGETVRFYVVAAGPSLDARFHVVGGVIDRAWVNSDMSRFQRRVQTVLVPAGGGAVFDVEIDAQGFYPFVSHAFAQGDYGQVGALRVGRPKRTIGH